MRKHCLEDAIPNFSQVIHTGDILVAGKNFGCGHIHFQFIARLNFRSSLGTGNDRQTDIDGIAIKNAGKTFGNYAADTGHFDGNEVYLCNPVIAAASAITGKISAPEEVEG